MVKVPKILAINPGATSTKLALFEGEQIVSEQQFRCCPRELEEFIKVVEQVAYRTGQVVHFMEQAGVKPADLDAIAARGGPLRPVPGGVYRVNSAMVEDASGGDFTEHVSKIACLIAFELSSEYGIPSFIVDPVSTDEYAPISRVSGLAEIPRKSLTHALNMKAAARYYAKEKGRRYDELNLITVQLGGGISVAVHEKGGMVDSVDANGEGPFSPERAGGLRADDLVRFVLDSGLDAVALRKKLTRTGGLVSHLGTTDAVDIEKRIEDGDAQALFYYQAMAYTVAKSIGSLAPAVCGKLDAILLTGGLARSEMLIKWITERVSFLAEVKCFPGEFEMQALAEGAMRVITGQEQAKIYPSGKVEL